MDYCSLFIGDEAGGGWIEEKRGLQKEREHMEEWQRRI
jgi:hypothetical protein